MCQTCGCYTPDPPKPGAKPRGEAQWALGYLEPQNPAEQAKREDDGLNVRARIESTYARKGFQAIWPSDLRSRFRWHGLYTQRPETDGYFMLRVRIPGGQLTAAQTDVIVMDYKMPGMDGLTAARAIRELRGEQPIILYTAYLDANIEAAAKDAGVALCIGKVEGLNQLERHITELCRDLGR